MLSKNARSVLWIGVLLGAVVSIVLLFAGGGSLPERNIIALGIVGALALTFCLYLAGWISNAPIPIGKPVRACIALLLSSLIMGLLCMLVWPRVSVAPDEIPFFQSAMEGQTYTLTVTNGKLYDVFSVIVKLTFNSNQPEFQIAVPKTSCKQLVSPLSANSMDDCVGFRCSNEPQSVNAYFYRLGPGEKREIIVAHTKNTPAFGSAQVRFFSKAALPTNTTVRGALTGFAIPLNIGDEGDGSCNNPAWAFSGDAPGRLVGPPSVQPIPGRN
jgi:hypothetical protein